MLDNLLVSYRLRIETAFKKLESGIVSEIADAIRETSERGQLIWIIGNGGSAATASHFATDMSRCTNSCGASIKAISLCDNSGLITAIGNDFGFDVIFLKQLSNVASRGDLLIALSASGNSRNILVAMEWARQNGVKTLAMTGFDGGRAKSLADVSIHVPTEIGDYGVAEDAHSILCHFLSSQFRTNKQELNF